MCFPSSEIRVISIKCSLGGYELWIYKLRAMTGSATLVFDAGDLKNAVFYLSVSTKALSNLSYFQLRFLTRQRRGKLWVARRNNSQGSVIRKNMPAAGMLACRLQLPESGWMRTWLLIHSGLTFEIQMKSLIPKGTSQEGWSRLFLG